MMWLYNWRMASRRAWRTYTAWVSCIRDLKPANVLLDGDRAKLADFGYSSAVVGGRADQSVCGTPRWMAPEVVFGRPYSFGADGGVHYLLM